MVKSPAQRGKAKQLPNQAARPIALAEAMQRLPELYLSPSAVERVYQTYCSLLFELGQHRTLEVRNLRDFLSPVTCNTHTIGVRFDVAGDPAIGLRFARAAARLALPTTFFLNHREPYFRNVYGGIDEGLAELVTAFLVAGPELGLKVVPWMAGDPAYLDNAEVITNDLAWLRQQLADIRGLAFDPPEPGIAAEGFEIFSGHGINDRRDVLAEDGHTVNLQLIDAGVLGLSYDANFAELIETPVAASALRTYFWLTKRDGPRSEVIQQAYWGHHPMLRRKYTNTIVLGTIDTWYRYNCNSSDPVQTYRDTRALVRWIADLDPADHRFLFIIDLRLLRY